MVLGGVALAIIAVFLPPLPVLWRRGCGAQLLINIGLLFLGWIPGVLHAWYIILNTPNIRQRHHIKQVRRRSMSESGYPRRSYGSRREDDSFDRPRHYRPRSASRHRDVVYERSRRGTPPPYYAAVDDGYGHRSDYYPPPATTSYRY